MDRYNWVVAEEEWEPPPGPSENPFENECGKGMEGGGDRP